MHIQGKIKSQIHSNYNLIYEIIKSYLTSHPEIKLKV